MRKPAASIASLGIYPLSAALVLALLWFQVPYGVLEQVIGLLIAIFLLGLNRNIFRIDPSDRATFVAKIALYLLASFLVQLIVATTGGVQSPFLILLHLTTLSLGLLVGLPASITFLASAVALMGGLFVIDPDTRDLFQADPGTTILYAVSLIAIAPITQIISHHYHLQDKMTKAFAEQARAASTLMDSLRQLVIVTDRNYVILSANNAVGEILRQPVNVLTHQSLGTLLFLKDRSGNLLTPPAAESLDKPIQVQDLRLLVRNSTQPYVVTVTFTPLTRLNGRVEQIGVVIEDARSPHGENDQLLDMLNAKERALLESLQGELIRRQILDLAAYAEVAKKVDRDATLLKALRQPIEPQVNLVDIAQLIRNTVAQEQPFAQAMATVLDFSILHYDAQDTQHIIVGELNLSPMDVTGAFFTLPINAGWFTYFLEEAIDLFLLIVGGTPQARVEISLDRQADAALVISLRTATSAISSATLPQLFTQNYGGLDLPNLRLSSAMEGYLAHTIAQQLGLNAEMNYDQDNQYLSLTITLPKH